MTTTLRDLFGAETGGLDEAASTIGSPDATEATVVRSGIRSLKLPGAATRPIVRFYGDATTKGIHTDPWNHFGFGIRFSDLTPGTAYEFFFTALVASSTGAGSSHISLFLDTNGDLLVKDVNGTNIVTTILAPVFTVDEFAYIDLYYRRHDTLGEYELWIDGVSKGTSSSQDFFDGSNDRTTIVAFMGPASGDGDVYIDDYYHISDDAAQPTRLTDTQGAEVFAYQNRTNSATPDTGDALSEGTSPVWQEFGNTPLTTPATDMGYNAAESGDIFSDDTASGENGRHGPHGDANIDGDILGAKFLHRLKRGNGAGTTHNKRYGNDSDAESETAVTLGTGFASFFTVSESATVVPLSTEHFSMGFSRGAGGRDIYCEEMWAFILHVPSAVEGFEAARQFGSVQPVQVPNEVVAY